MSLSIKGLLVLQDSSKKAFQNSSDFSHPYLGPSLSAPCPETLCQGVEEEDEDEAMDQSPSKASSRKHLQVVKAGKSFWVILDLRWDLFCLDDPDMDLG